MQHSVPKKRRTINRNCTLETQGENRHLSQAENVESQLESSCSSSFLQDPIYPVLQNINMPKTETEVPSFGDLEGSPESFKLSIKARSQHNLGKTIENWSKHTKLTKSFAELNNFSFPLRKRSTRKTQLSQSSPITRRNQKRKVEHVINSEKGGVGNILSDDQTDGSFNESTSIAVDEFKPKLRKRPKLNNTDDSPPSLPPPFSPTNDEVTEDPLGFSPDINNTEKLELKEEHISSSSADQTNYLGLCRFCMSEISLEFVDIFSDSNEAIEIREMCDLVLPDKIQPSDGLPPNICYQCITDLQISSSFIMRFIEVDHSLRLLFSNFENCNEPDSSVEGKFKCENTLPKTSGGDASEAFIVDEISIDEACMEEFIPYKQEYSSDVEPHVAKIVDVIKLTNVNQDKVYGRENENSLTERCRENLEQHTADVVSDVNNLIVSQNEIHTLKGNKNTCGISDIDTDLSESVKTPTNREIKRFDCEKVFPSATACIEHVCEKHNLECSECQQVFSTQTKLDAHYLGQHGIRIDREYCGKVFKGAKFRKKHETCHGQNMDFQKEEYALENLTTKTHKENSGEKISDIVEINNLIDTKDEISSSKETENVSFNEKSLEKTLAEKYVLECGTKELQQRISSSQGPTEREIHLKTVCFHCEEVFSSVIACNQHVSQKHNFVCSDCQKGFPTQTELDWHIITTHDKRLECQYCGKVFKKSQLQKKHEIWHEVNMDFYKNDYQQREKRSSEIFKESSELNMTKRETLIKVKCSHCEAVFTSTLAHNQHVNKKHSFKCSVCHRMFSTQKKLDGHHLSKHDKRVECQYCGKVFKDPSYRRKHENQHELKMDFKKEEYNTSRLCFICGVVLCSKTSIEAHMRRHENIRPFMCENCGSKFTTKSDLQKHVSHHDETALKEMRFACNVCSKRFAFKVNLYHHQRTHMKTFRFNCEYCDRGFYQRNNLVYHLKKRTLLNGVCPEPNKALMTFTKKERELTTRYECDICGRKFVRSLNCKKHKDLHFLKGDQTEIQKQLEEPEIHFCTECDQYCFSKTELEAHVKEHEVLTKTYDCEFCGKKYSSKKFLTVHLINHKGETPFKCGVCSRSFTTNNKLCQHKLVHTEERPFVCQICQKPFKSKKYLELHSAKHEPEVPARGAQPFKCPKCGRNYRREFYLKKHIKRVHTSNAYRCVCSLCGRVLKSESDVQIHKLRAHREAMEGVSREATEVESDGTSEEDTEEEWSSDGEIEEENTIQDQVAVEHLIAIPNSNIQIEYIISPSELDSTQIVC